MAARFVKSSDGTSIAVFESGNPDAQPVVLVHGYPDNHHVWDGVAAILAENYYVITYDVRGAGESDKPAAIKAYKIPQLNEDLRVVIDTLSPDRAVHVVAHDWGSIQTWGAVCNPAFADRIKSYTSISGPSLDMAGQWLRNSHKHPIASARQLSESFYIALFQLPVIPEALARNGGIDFALKLLSAPTNSAVGVQGEAPRGEPDLVNGIQLYRANMVQRLGRPKPVPTDIPVQVLAPKGDAHVSARLAMEAPVPYVRNLRAQMITGGHWVVHQRPDMIAEHVRGFIEHVDGAPRPVRFDRIERTGRHGKFANDLVIVTGGARGIGRATALEFAREGADVIIADLDEVAAKETAAEVAGLGVDAFAYALDVSDQAGWEAFADKVKAEHGVPDVIVNNAGIGMGGSFLNTSVDDWQKILGVNLWGVIHGSRLFAQQMVDAGNGGHIVNIASAAAFSPSKIYPAYATTKAAVLMLSECMRAELGREGVAVTAICPGFIDTDISKSTIHVGVDEKTQAELRDHAVKAYGRRNYTPERLAKHAVRAVAANRAVAVITPEAKLLRTISRFAPRIGRQVAKVDLNKI